MRDQIDLFERLVRRGCEEIRGELTMIGTGLERQREESVVARVVDMLKAGAITLEQLGAKAGVAVPAAATVAGATMMLAPADAPVAVRQNLRLQAAYVNAVKYRDPQTQQGWSGRGPMPKWLKAKLAAGATLDAYKVGGEGEAAAPAAAPAPVEEAAVPAAAPEIGRAHV